MFLKVVVVQLKGLHRHMPLREQSLPRMFPSGFSVKCDHTHSGEFCFTVSVGVFQYHLLSTYFVPGTVIGPESVTVNKMASLLTDPRTGPSAPTHHLLQQCEQPTQPKSLVWLTASVGPGRGAGPVRCSVCPRVCPPVEPRPDSRDAHSLLWRPEPYDNGLGKSKPLCALWNLLSKHSILQILTELQK